MPERGSYKGSPYLFVAFGDRGGIDSVHVFFTLPSDAKIAAEARALIQGTNKYQVYRINRQNSGDLDFERVK